MPIEGTNVDPGELLVAKEAVKQTVSTFTYMGVNVGNYITDEEVTQVAVAVLQASAAFRAGKTI